jgi:pheromone alpha factor receptor
MSDPSGTMSGPPEVVSVPPDFNPLTQDINFIMRDGTVFPVPLTQIDLYRMQDVVTCSIFAAQFGACFVMLLVVCVTARAARRKSPIFIMNSLALVLNIARCLMQLINFTGGFANTYRLNTGDYAGVDWGQYVNIVLGTVVTLLLVNVLELSLLLQTNVVLTTMRDWHRWVVLALSACVTLAAVGCRFAVCILNSQAALGTQVPQLHGLESATLITMTVSVWYYCLIFTGKLGWSIWMRRKMGLKQWGPLQIICVMGGCTMIIPCKYSSSSSFATHHLPFGYFSHAHLLLLAAYAVSHWILANLLQPSSPSYNTKASVPSPKPTP